MRIRLSREAVQDLGAIADYLETRNPAAAVAVERALKDALELIRSHPHAGRRYERDVRRLTVPRYPYLVFYRIDETSQVIGVLSIRHAGRPPLA